MADIRFNVADFRLLYPAFASSSDYPDALLQSCFDQATCYLSNKVSGHRADCLTRECRTLALNQLTAHFCIIGRQAAAGKSASVKTSSSVGSVSVSTTPPPFGNSLWAYWFSTTPYGQAFIALMRSCTAAGFYFGGRPERSAFRKVGGGF